MKAKLLALKDAVLKMDPKTQLILADQVMVSGSNFAIAILLARFMGVETYGVYSLAWMGVIFASSLLQALISVPMMSIFPALQPSEKPAYLAQTFVLQVAFVGIVGVLALGLVFGADEWFPDWGIGFLFPVLPLAVCSFLFQEYFRRLFFAQQKSGYALIIDMVAYVGFVGTVTAIYFLGGLTLRVVFWSVAGSFGLAALLGYLLSGLGWAGWKSLMPVFQKHWSMGSWLIGKSVLQFFSANYFILAAAALLGPAAVGGLKVAQNLMGASHIFFLAMENMVPVKAAQAYRSGGEKGMWEYLNRNTRKSAWGIGAILCVLAVLHHPLIVGIYGAEYGEYSYLLMAFCVLYVFIFPGYPLRFALRTLGRTRPIFIAYGITTVLSLLLAEPVVAEWGLMGVMYGLIGQQIIMLVVYLISLKYKPANVKPKEA
ncbi:hypothetical protein [Pontibacter sp. G13]|uniref:lipopolysaccharide biosynthesis protein n=1 Tax=Pontibacter sp. G13 TaxID=3074898 RepID=UPI00288A75D4|nr:hypothetical protein [Pontibacter sp. G13]WNJ19317.1 hypothetical protein RJD25_02395 [Pontibacter sp. G13]